MKKYLKLNNILTLVLIVIIAVILLLLFTKHKMFYVKTNSMDPDIPQWSLVVDKTYQTKKEFYANVNVGSDITFITESGNTLTHRIVFIDSENDIIQTQGIKGNAALDKEISFKQVLGVVSFSIPLLGYVVMLCQIWYFWVMLICVCLCVIIIKTIIKESKK